MDRHRLRTQSSLALLLCIVFVGAEAHAVGAALKLAESRAEIVISAGNVYEHENYWPNIVSLARDWTPPGADQRLGKSTQGVLIRVEPGEWARVDFGRHGKARVPIEATDLVDRANAVRLGRLHKTAPNFLLQIGTRLIDSRSVGARAMQSSEIAGAESFLVVFGDPRVPAFWRITQDLAPLQYEPGVQAIFVPQAVGREDTGLIKDQLRVSGWAMPFSYPRLSANYTRSLLEDAPSEPYAMLVTPEGRVLFRSGLAEAGVVAGLREAIRLRGKLGPAATVP